MEIGILKEVTGFEWDIANIAHIARHGVIPEEAEEVFSDSNNALLEDTEHSQVEKRFIIIGKTEHDRLLYQIFTRRGNQIRIISSRTLNRKEVSLYEKEIDRTKVSK